MTRGRLSPLQTAVLDEFFAHERGFFLSDGGALAGFHLKHRETTEAFLDEASAKDGGCTPATLAWLLSQWQLPERLKVPAGYDVEQLRGFKDELAERMAVAAHPTT
jgi:hypothetical protein